MYINPENIELKKLVKKRTFNFNTPKRNYGNAIFVATDSYDDYSSVFTSQLFKPVQLFSVYTPRKIKPLNRSYITYVQKDIYSDIREKTNGFLKIGKAMLSSYTGKNLAYNLIPEYTETRNLLETFKKNYVSIHMYMEQYLINLISEKVDLLNYEKNYLIFPMVRYIEDFRKSVMVNTLENTSPIIEMLKMLRSGGFDKTLFSRVNRIFFYNPNANAMVVIDPQDPELTDKFLVYFEKIIRLNNFNNGTEEIEDESTEVESTEDDDEENTKSKIKEIVLRNVAKELKANLTDFDSASSTEKSIITTIDNKIDSYLNKEENTEKPFSELVKTIETDPDVKSKAISYVETKSIAKKQLMQLQKNLDKETEIVGSIKDLKTENEFKTIEPQKIDATLPDIINKKVQESSLISMDETYNKYQFKEDIVNSLTSFSDQDYLPVALTDYKVEDTSDDFNLKETLSARFTTNEGKSLSFKIDIPKIYDGHYVKIKGNPYIIQKQIFHLPIVKTKTDRVEITTNFNKITCERTNGKLSRRNAYLKKILSLHKMSNGCTIEYGYNIELNSSYSNDFEYEEMSSFLGRVSNNQYDIHLNRPDVEKEFELLNYPDSFTITKDMTPVGFEKIAGEDTKFLIYIDNTDGTLLETKIKPDGILETIKLAKTLYEFIVRDILHDNPDKEESIGKSYIYSHCKFIAVVYPIFVFCGLCVGITSVLQKAKIKYKLSNTQLPHSSNWVEVKFKNKFMYYEDTTTNSLLLNILYAMHTEEKNYEEFDTDEPYAQYCVEDLGQPIFVKQTIKINISKLIDPITRDVLNYMKLPTDPVDLLLLANKMLSNNSYISQNDMSNYRIRGNELIPAMLYEIIAKAYMKYQNSKYNGSNKEALKIPQNALIAQLISMRNVPISSDLNPVLEIEASSACSMRGLHGVNLRDAYTPELRSFDKSMDGVLSANSTPFSGAVGISRSLTVNPKICNVRGFMPTTDLKDLDATNRLSASELLSFTTATRSDAPRAAMEVSQSKHGVPVYKSHRQLIGSGFDHSLPYMLSNTFCFKAKEDGVVDSINVAKKIATLKYNDGTFDAIDLKESLAKNSNSGFYISQKYEMKYKEGESFKKGDILAYNPSFFQGKGNDCCYTQGTLAKVAITPGDFVFEDSTYISDRLSEECSSDITMAVPVSLGPNTIIHSIAKVGDHVQVNDDLLNFTTSFKDPTTTAFLQDLIDTVGDGMAKDMGNETILSKYPGTIADIDVYYNVELNELSDSLKTLIKNYNKSIEERKAELIHKGVHPTAIHLKPTGMQTETKINGTEFEGVLIIFYITHKDKLTVGDKITYSVALKGIVTKVSSVEESPFSEFRPNDIIDGCTSSSGIPGRMTMDVFPQLYGNKLLIELGRWIHDEWKK